MMTVEKRVGIGEVMIAQADTVLSAYGVGSCVVIILYEPTQKVGGLAHILLPVGPSDNTKYPRGAIAELCRRFDRIGVNAEFVIAKIVGGATMFEGFQQHAIGNRNVNQTREELNRLGIRIVAEDVFGTWGRTILFYVSDGRVIVKSFKHGEKIL
jgi:chemotaxis protein CheD